MMQTWSEIFDALGGVQTVAKAIGVKREHAHVMKHRNSIPAEYWSDLVDCAKAQDVPGVDFKTLASLAAKSRKQREAAE